jgi:hypothetical protein
MDNLKKEKVSGFDQPLFKANLTADRIWLADLLCYRSTTTSRQFCCSSIFLSAFTMNGAKLLFFIIRHFDNFSLFNLVIESICYELLLTVYLAVLRSVRVKNWVGM